MLGFTNSCLSGMPSQIMNLRCSNFVWMSYFYAKECVGSQRCAVRKGFAATAIVDREESWVYSVSLQLNSRFQLQIQGVTGLCYSS